MDFANNRKEEYGPGVQETESSAHLDASAPRVPSAVALPQQPPPAAGAAASAAAFPSASSLTSARAAASSIHLPVSAPLGAGSAAPAAPEEMVSAVKAGAALGRGVPTCLYVGYFELRTYFLMAKKVHMVFRPSHRKHLIHQVAKTLICNENNT